MKLKIKNHRFVFERPPTPSLGRRTTGGRIEPTLIVLLGHGSNPTTAAHQNNVEAVKMRRTTTNPL